MTVYNLSSTPPNEAESPFPPSSFVGAVESDGGMPFIPFLPGGGHFAIVRPGVTTVAVELASRRIFDIVGPDGTGRHGRFRPQELDYYVIPTRGHPHLVRQGNVAHPDPPRTHLATYVRVAQPPRNVPMHVKAEIERVGRGDYRVVGLQRLLPAMVICVVTKEIVADINRDGKPGEPWITTDGTFRRLQLGDIVLRELNGNGVVMTYTQFARLFAGLANTTEIAYPVHQIQKMVRRAKG